MYLITTLRLISMIIKKYNKVAVALFIIFVFTFPLISNAEDINSPAKHLKSFYSNESERVIMFKKPIPESTPFDIVILHICSLSWDDFKEVGITQEDPFIKQFDYLFTDFNTASGYSGPAVIRLLNGNCGQKPLQKILPEKDNICLLMDSLTSVGYETYISLNHDGKYGDFIDNINKNVLSNKIMLLPDNLTATATFFDGKTPLYSDFAMLEKWFKDSKASNSKMKAFYYNTATLHAGSRWIGEKRVDSDTHNQYKVVLSVLLKDIKKFIELLKSSKRNTVLIFVPEHGRALTGSAFQIADLRDIPLPKITKVPVGVKFFGPKFNDVKGKQYIISKPASYLAISWMLSKFIENSPFGNTAETPDDIISKIPMTELVSDHEGRVIMEMDGSYLFYGKDRKWITLMPDQLK